MALVVQASGVSAFDADAASRVRCRRPLEDAVLCETADRTAIRELELALRSRSPRGLRRCMCVGTLIFEIELAAGSSLEITLHHGKSIVLHESTGNVDLLDRDALMDWLSARGVTFVREDYEQAQGAALRKTARDRRWHEAMPRSLRGFFEDMQTSGLWSRPEWTEAIAVEFPNPVLRARALLELFGSGRGVWGGQLDGVPSWELFPERLLLDMELEVLLEAIGTTPGERIREGAARLFSSQAFSATRALPVELRRLLIEHVEATREHGDRLLRARSALG